MIIPNHHRCSSDQEIVHRFIHGMCTHCCFKDVSDNVCKVYSLILQLLEILYYRHSPLLHPSGSVPTTSKLVCCSRTCSPRYPKLSRGKTQVPSHIAFSAKKMRLFRGELVVSSFSTKKTYLLRGTWIYHNPPRKRHVFFAEDSKICFHQSTVFS